MAPKELEITLPFIKGLFFANNISNELFKLVIFSSVFLAINPWFASFLYKKIVIELFLKYEIKPLFNLVICSNIA
jgi:hypothetical protein